MFEVLSFQSCQTTSHHSLDTTNGVVAMLGGWFSGDVPSTSNNVSFEIPLHHNHGHVFHVTNYFCLGCKGGGVEARERVHEEGERKRQQKKRRR